jgi:CelD/BcsL family acetyltransferase involved in cellulose biosynthesis
MRSIATEAVGRTPSTLGMTSPMRLSVGVRRDLDLSSDDAAALDALIDAHPPVGVFLSRAWLSGLFADPPSGFEPSFLIVRDGIALRGALPIAVREERTFVRVTLLGGSLGSDRTDLLAARGLEAACADACLAWMAGSFGRKGFVLEMRDVPDGSPLWGSIHRASMERTLRLVLQPREIHVLPYLDLTEAPSRVTGPSTAQVSRSLDKHRRWLTRRGHLRIDILEDKSEVLTAFDSLVRFLHARWHGEAELSVLDTPRVQRFHRLVLPRLLEEGRLRMVRVSSDMRTVAVFYGLAAGHWWGYYLAGYDREWAGRIHLGRIMLATAIDLAAQQGATEFDFLQGAERVKYLWPVRERVTVDADLYSTTPGAQLARAARASRQAAAALVKCACSLVVTSR